MEDEENQRAVDQLPVHNGIIEVRLKDPEKDWTDYTKLGAEVLGPLVTVWFGIYILKVTKVLERGQWHGQKMIEERIKIWDTLGPFLNDIYCYCARVGQWKESSPLEIIVKKRKADQLFFGKKAFFSEEFTSAYLKFMSECFVTNTGKGEDAKIRASDAEHRPDSYRGNGGWQTAWSAHFGISPDEQSLESSYARLTNQIRSEFGDTTEPSKQATAPPRPQNIVE